jgi:hypothetical protein
LFNTSRMDASSSIVFLSAGQRGVHRALNLRQCLRVVDALSVEHAGRGRPQQDLSGTPEVVAALVVQGIEQRVIRRRVPIQVREAIQIEQALEKRRARAGGDIDAPAAEMLVLLPITRRAALERDRRGSLGGSPCWRPGRVFVRLLVGVLVGSYACARRRFVRVLVASSSRPSIRHIFGWEFGRVCWRETAGKCLLPRLGFSQSPGSTPPSWLARACSPC